MKERILSMATNHLYAFKSDCRSFSTFLPAPVTLEDIRKEQLRLIQSENLESITVVIKRDGSGVQFHCHRFSKNIKEFLQNPLTNH
jgi:hypothetical protein